MMRRSSAWWTLAVLTILAFGCQKKAEPEPAEEPKVEAPSPTVDTAEAKGPEVPQDIVEVPQEVDSAVKREVVEAPPPLILELAEAESSAEALEAVRALLGVSHLPLGSLARTPEGQRWLAVEGDALMGLVEAPQEVPSGTCAEPKRSGQWWAFPSSPMAVLQLSDRPHFWIYDEDTRCLRPWLSLQLPKRRGVARLHLERAEGASSEQGLGLGEVELLSIHDGMEKVSLEEDGFVVQTQEGATLFAFSMKEEAAVSMEISRLEVYESKDAGALLKLVASASDPSRGTQSAEWTWTWARDSASPRMSAFLVTSQRKTNGADGEVGKEELKVERQQYWLEHAALKHKLVASSKSSTTKEAMVWKSVPSKEGLCDREAQRTSEVRGRTFKDAWVLSEREAEVAMSDLYPLAAGVVLAELEEPLEASDFSRFAHFQAREEGELVDGVEGKELALVDAKRAIVESSRGILFEHVFDPCEVPEGADGGLLKSAISIDRRRHDRASIIVLYDRRYEIAGNELARCKEESQTDWSPEGQEVVFYEATRVHVQPGACMPGTTRPAQ